MAQLDTRLHADRSRSLRIGERRHVHLDLAFSLALHVVPAMRKEPEMMRSHGDPRVAFAIAIALALALWATPAPAAETYSYDTQSRLTDVSYQNGSSLHYT